MSGVNRGENKWLHNGRNNEGVVQSKKESTLNSKLNEEISNRGVGEHMLYGRVTIDRDPISKKMVFFKRARRKVNLLTVGLLLVLLIWEMF